MNFVYGNADFAGAEYNIYAADDIYSQDKVTKVHKAGDLVESLTTGEDGSAVSKELYLGKYKFVEQKAPENLVIGKTEQERTQFGDWENRTGTYPVCNLVLCRTECRAIPGGNRFYQCKTGDFSKCSEKIET